MITEAIRLVVGARQSEGKSVTVGTLRKGVYELLERQTVLDDGLKGKVKAAVSEWFNGQKELGTEDLLSTRNWAKVSAGQLAFGRALKTQSNVKLAPSEELALVCKCYTEMATRAPAKSDEGQFRRRAQIREIVASILAMLTGDELTVSVVQHAWNCVRHAHGSLTKAQELIEQAQLAAFEPLTMPVELQPA